MTHTFMRLDSPSFMMVPLPKWPSMELTTLCSALAWITHPYRVSQVCSAHANETSRRVRTPPTLPDNHLARITLGAYPLGPIRPIAVTVCSRLLAGGAPRRRVRDERPSCGYRRSRPRSLLRCASHQHHWPIWRVVLFCAPSSTGWVVVRAPVAAALPVPWWWWCRANTRAQRPAGLWCPRRWERMEADAVCGTTGRRGGGRTMAPPAVGEVIWWCWRHRAVPVARGHGMRLCFAWRRGRRGGWL